MKRALLVGVGEVGLKHLDALVGTDGLGVVGVADPAPAAAVPMGVPSFGTWQSALAVLRPDVVVVATPPGTGLTVARAAARTGAVVLVEKPVTLLPAGLAPAPGDERVFVAFQPHFAPGLEELVRAARAVTRAEVTLACRRDRPYFRGWRARYATAGGVLHQQAIHGLALALRLIPTAPITSCIAAATHRRQWAETEDRIHADIRFSTGAMLTVDARVDGGAPPHHDVVLHMATGDRLHVRGRNLEAGLGPVETAPNHQSLRRAMYRALLGTADGGPAHPCLFPLAAMRRTLEVIDHVYRSAGVASLGSSGTAA